MFAMIVSNLAVIFLLNFFSIYRRFIEPWKDHSPNARLDNLVGLQTTFFTLIVLFYVTLNVAIDKQYLHRHEEDFFYYASKHTIFK